VQDPVQAATFYRPVIDDLESAGASSREKSRKRWASAKSADAWAAERLLSSSVIRSAGADVRQGGQRRGGRLYCGSALCRFRQHFVDTILDADHRLFFGQSFWP
jgi:hypothetical protein